MENKKLIEYNKPNDNKKFLENKRLAENKKFLNNKKLLKQVGISLLIILAGILYFNNEIKNLFMEEESAVLIENGEKVITEEIVLQDFVSDTNTQNINASDSNTQRIDKSDEIVKQETKEEYIYIHVCGSVMSPGVYKLKKASRVYEAIEMAGGFTELAATDAINQAQELIDGVKLYIPTLDEVNTTQSMQDSYITSSIHQNAFSTDGNNKSESKININTADKSTLMTLQGIGEAKAQSIIAYREEYGAFETINDLLKISGIKEAVYSKIKDYITVSN